MVTIRRRPSLRPNLLKGAPEQVYAREESRLEERSRLARLDCMSARSAWSRVVPALSLAAAVALLSAHASHARERASFASVSPSPVQAVVPTGRGPCCLAVTAGGVWLGLHRDGSIEQISPVTNRVVWTWKASLTFDYGGLLALDGELWLLQFSIGGPHPPLTRIDPTTHKISTVSGLTNPTAFAGTGNSIWVSSLQDPWLREVDARTGRVVSKIRVPGVQNTVIGLASPRALWLTSVNHFTPVLDRVDPRTGRLLTRLRPFGPDAIVRGIGAVGKALWISVAASSGPTLVHVDLRTNQITQRLRPAVGGNSDAFPAITAPGDGTLWLQTTPTAITEINPGNGNPIRTLKLPVDPSHPIDDYWNSTLAFGFGSYWITSYPGQGGLNDPSTGALIRIATQTR
jgi:hypothetical protein